MLTRKMHDSTAAEFSARTDNAEGCDGSAGLLLAGPDRDWPRRGGPQCRTSCECWRPNRARSAAVKRRQVQPGRVRKCDRVSEGTANVLSRSQASRARVDVRTHPPGSPQKLVSYFGLNPRVRQSGLGAAHHGRISKVGRSHARAMLVEAAWAAAKAPGPLHAFFVRIRAKRGHQIAAVAVARKLTVFCWHLLTRAEDYHWARPPLVAHKNRALELQAGRPMKKGNQRGPAYAYNIKALRDQELLIAGQAERAYEHFSTSMHSATASIRAACKPRPPTHRHGAAP